MFQGFRTHADAIILHRHANVTPLFEGGRPFVDLPACLGGPPPGDGARPPSGAGAKVEACRRCPIDEACAGVPPPLLAMPGLREAIAPPPHWMPIPDRARIAVVCPRAFDTIYTRYHGRVLRALQCSVRDFHAAEDLTQDVFMCAMRKLATYEVRPEQPLRSWLLAILHNIFVDRTRRRRSEGQRLERVAEIADTATAPAQP